MQRQHRIGGGDSTVRINVANGSLALAHADCGPQCVEGIGRCGVGTCSGGLAAVATIGICWACKYDEYNCYQDGLPGFHWSVPPSWLMPFCDRVIFIGMVPRTPIPACLHQGQR